MMLKNHVIRRSLRGGLLKRAFSNAGAPSSAPPLLQRIRNDMKEAMRAKDKNRLDVLRGLVADVTNADKSSSPVKSDADMLKLIAKRKRESQAAAKDAEAAERNDLRDKELLQVSLLEGYVSTSGALSEMEIQDMIQAAFQKLKAESHSMNKGAIMKAMLGSGGAFDGKLVDRKIVASKVDEALSVT